MISKFEWKAKTFAAAALAGALCLPAVALAQDAPAEPAQALRESTVRGTIKAVEPAGKIQLDVQGQSIEVDGTERQVRGYNAGDEILATVVPLARAESLKPLEEASMEEQAAANEPFNNVVVGRVLDLQQNVALLDVPGEGRRRIQLSEGAANEVVLGRNYVVTLASKPEVNQFQLRDIRKQ